MSPEDDPQYLYEAMGFLLSAPAVPGPDAE
jgi:hypothetical protein